jgi:hypothetical protein
MVGMTLLDRVEERLLLCEVAEHCVQICLCDRKRWNLGIAEVQNITLVLFVQQADFVDVHDILSVASYQTCTLETVFHCLETAAHHVFGEISFAVCVPDFYVVIV